MPTALECVKDVYDRFAQGDLAGFMELCADDVEWVVNGPPILEKCRAFSGRAGVQEFLDILGRTWQFNEFSPIEFVVDGDTVVVLGEEDGIDIESGTPFNNRWVHVFDVADGKIRRFREFLCHWTGEQQPPEMSWTSA